MKKTIMVDGNRMTVEAFSKATGRTVQGDLDAWNTAITALPEGLSVGGSLDLDPYQVSFPRAGRMRIGCQEHTLDAWEGFTDSQIAAMDRQTALRFWKTWKAPLLSYARAHAAKAEKEAAE